jgi:hypothetical protein
VKVLEVPLLQFATKYIIRWEQIGDLHDCAVGTKGRSTYMTVYQTCRVEAQMWVCNRHRWPKHIFWGCIECESRCLRLTAVEMSGSEYGASKNISSNHFTSQVMRVMVPARFKSRKRAGVYFKREVRCRHPVAQ